MHHSKFKAGVAAFALCLVSFVASAQGVKSLTCLPASVAGGSGGSSTCTVTRSSGVAELDALTCRLVQQRFVYRPSTDRYGRPIADEVDGEHDWIPR